MPGAGIEPANCLWKRPVMPLHQPGGDYDDYPRQDSNLDLELRRLAWLSVPPRGCSATARSTARAHRQPTGAVRLTFALARATSTNEKAPKAGRASGLTVCERLESARYPVHRFWALPPRRAFPPRAALAARWPCAAAAARANWALAKVMVLLPLQGPHV